MGSDSSKICRHLVRFSRGWRAFLEFSQVFLSLANFLEVGAIFSETRQIYFGFSLRPFLTGGILVVRLDVFGLESGQIFWRQA